MAGAPCAGALMDRLSLVPAAGDQGLRLGAKPPLGRRAGLGWEGLGQSSYAYQ